MGTILRMESLRKNESECGMSRNACAIDGNVNNYFKWNLEVFHMEKDKKILDLGCGPGLYADIIMSDYSPSLYVAADYSKNFTNQIQERLIKYDNGESIQIDFLDSEQIRKLYKYKFDYVLFFDVLEHIEDEEKALCHIKDLIQNTGSGLLFLRVPALQYIYGVNDEAIGHYRRYNLKSLKALLERCAFSVKSICYQNLAGVIPWFIIGKILMRSLSVSGNEGKTFDTIVPFIKPIERLISPPVGLSLYCTCTVNA